MTASRLSTPDQLLDRLEPHLSRALRERFPERVEENLSMTPVDPAPSEEPRRVLRVEGPDEISFEVELEVRPEGEEGCDLHVAIEGGRNRHFTCPLSGGDEHRNVVREVGRAVASFVLHEIERRGERSFADPFSSEVPPHVPLLLLDETGRIQDFTNGARRLLEYSPEGSIDRNFFSHVHGQNMRYVMRDLAQLASRQKQQARWLVRLWTGNDRWRWYRAVARPDLSEDAVRMFLRRV